MKKLFFIVAVCFVSRITFAQLSATLVVSATPPATIIDWYDKKDVLTYLVANQSGAPARVIIKAELRTTDGTLAAGTNLVTAKIYNVGGGTLILSAADVLPLQTMIFNGRFKTALQKTGKLPAGSYQLCVQLVTPGNFLPVSQQSCRTFTIAAFQLPIPMMPADGAELDAGISKTAIIFRWTPVAPKPTLPVTYRILVFEVLENQTPMQALRSNQPLLAKDIIGTTQYTWQPQLVFKTSSSNDSLAKKEIATRFTWTIQTFDDQHRPFGDGNINGDGISEPSVFLVKPSVIDPKK